jgi:uncharacterized protein with PQ loop repeat
MTTTTLGILASAIFLIRLLPQPIRLARHGVSAGVSPLATLNALVADAAWIGYGLWAGLPIVWLVSVAAALPGLWATALLRRDITPGDITAAVAWAGAVLLSAVVGAIDIVLGAGVLVTQGPSVLKALREDDLRGIAPATWWISIADAAAWGAYGLAVGSAALMGYGLVLTASALIVLGRIWWTARSPDTELATAPA